MINNWDYLSSGFSCGFLTLWLGNWQRTEVMLLAYWAMTLRILFSTLGGMRPDTLVMISCSSNSGSEGSLKVFIRVATHCFSCRREHAQTTKYTDDTVEEDVQRNPEMYLAAKVGLFEAVAIHDFN